MTEPDAGYGEVTYQQFSPSPAMAAALQAAGVLVTPLVWPLAACTRGSDTLFRTASEALSLVPYALGVVLRAQFYRRALRRCGHNLVTEFGSVFVYPDVSIGDNVLIGRFTIVHHCDVGDYALIGERCTFLSGSRQHRFDRTDVPIALQGGQRRRITVGRDCWIGSHSVVMDDVGDGSVVAAGSVVTAGVEPGSVVAGNPARLRRRRAAPVGEGNGAVPGKDAAAAQQPQETWSEYWEGMGHRRIFEVEAGDHVARLRQAVPVRPTDRILDFGCGFGHVAALLAPTVAAVGYWDAAQRMRSATAHRTAALPNVALVDLAEQTQAAGTDRFDLIVANSVVQYMSAAELAGWLPRWRALLAPGGRIVLSDVPAPGASASGELGGMLRFAARHRFLLTALRDGVAEARRYSRSRGDADLQRWTPDGLAALAAEHGLRARTLPANLTHRTGRFSFFLDRDPAP